MKRRLAAAVVLIPLVWAGIVYLPLLAFICLIDGISVLSLRELFSLFSCYGIVGYGITFPLLALLPWVWIYSPTLRSAYLCLAALLLFVWTVIRTPDLKAGLPSAAGNLLAFFYLGIPLALTAHYQPGRLELLMVLCVIWVSDSTAFLVGRKWGTHKVTPRISPQKSLEGYLAQIISSTMGCIIFGLQFFPHWPVSHLLLIGLALGWSGLLGDLFESILKRGAGLKDSSNLIPGHGGLLDRIDSFLFALPVYYLLSALLE